MTDTPERALLRRLDEAWRDGGEASHSFEVLTQVLREARALLAEAEGEDEVEILLDPARPSWPGVLLVVGDDVVRIEAGNPLNFADSKAEAERLRARMRPTPRSRAEGSDLSVDQGREFRVVDGLGDSNRAGKVTIDPTLLSPPTPRSRAQPAQEVDWIALAKQYRATWPVTTKYPSEYAEAVALEIVFGPLLTRPAPRSRAEAEAMVREFGLAVASTEPWLEKKARLKASKAALLNALTGGTE